MNPLNALNSLITTLLVSTGADSSAPAAMEAAPEGPIPVSVDLDRDGIDDLVLLRPGQADALLVADGDGGYRDVTLRAGLTPSASRHVSAVDFDGDGANDLLRISMAGELELLRQEVNGTFSDATSRLVGAEGPVNHAVWLRGSTPTEPDLLVVAANGATTVFHNRRGFFEARPIVLEPGALAAVLAPAPSEPTSFATEPEPVDGTSPAARGVARSGGSRQPVPSTAISSTTSSSAGLAPLIGVCAGSITDQATGSCLQASSAPALGRLYPLSSDLFVSGAGFVGLGTTLPQARLQVAGDSIFDGDVAMRTDTDSITFSQVSGTSSPMMQMFAGGTNNASRMVLGHSPAFSSFGLRYDDPTDRFIFQASDSAPVFSVNLLDDSLSSYVPQQFVGPGGATLSLQQADPLDGRAELNMYDHLGNRTVQIDASNLGSGEGFAEVTYSASGIFNVAGIVAYSSGGAGNYYGSIGNSVLVDTADSSVRLDARSASTTSTAPTIYASNNSGSANAFGVHAEMVATLPGGFSAAVRGQHQGTGGSGIGVWGSQAGSGYGVYGTVSSVTGHAVVGSGAQAVTSWGDLTVTGVKGFAQPHPTDPSLEVRFAALEGNESGTYFRGTDRIQGGVAVLDIPEEFRWVTEADGLTVQLTAVGGPGQLWVESQGLDAIVVGGDRDVTFNYFVQGRRRGFDQAEVVRSNRNFVPRYKGEPFGEQYPQELRELMVESGLLNADYTPNESTAARHGWTLIDRAEVEAQIAADRAAAERVRVERRGEMAAPHAPAPTEEGR